MGEKREYALSAELPPNAGVAAMTTTTTAHFDRLAMAAPAKAAPDKTAGFLWGTLLVMVGCGLNNLVLEYMVE